MKIGIDLGGTKLLIGVVDDLGNIIDSYIEKTEADKPKEVVINQLISLIEKYFNHDITLIGIGVPAIVDSEKGIVYNAVSIPSWDEVHLKDILEERFKIPVHISNDCNCFARGILQSNEYKKYEDLVCITLGTGVGSGLIFNRHLYTGKDSLAGEIGSIQYLDKDYEYYCSSRFFLSKGTTGKEAGEKAANGDKKSLQLWEELGDHLGELLHTVLYTYNPQAIIFGGSIANSFRFFEKSMMKKLYEFPYSNVTQKVSIFTTDTRKTMIIGSIYT